MSDASPFTHEQAIEAPVQHAAGEQNAAAHGQATAKQRQPRQRSDKPGRPRKPKQQEQQQQEQQQQEQQEQQQQGQPPQPDPPDANHTVHQDQLGLPAEEHIAVLGSADAADDRWDSMCRSCQQVGDLLCCEGPGCTVAMHAHCAGLHDIPEEDWFCSACSPAAGKAAGKGKRRKQAGSKRDGRGQPASKRPRGSAGSKAVLPMVATADVAFASMSTWAGAAALAAASHGVTDE
jgi:hypothetical protein